MITLANYLFFTTMCEPALALYTRCGLGEVVELVRYGAGAGAMAGKVMHSRFEGPGVRFFASDNADAEPMRGSAHMLTIDSRARMTELFAQLADGGTITTPLGTQPWGFYGKLTDRYGVQWMMIEAATSSTPA